MNAAERRIVHQAVKDFADVETVSEGEDPHRRVVVMRNRRRMKFLGVSSGTPFFIL